MKKNIFNLHKISYNHILAFIFVFLIAFPYIFAHRGKEARASYTENRMLASYPSITVDGKLNTNLLSEYESWLSDNLRGRTIIVKAYSTLQDKLFGRIVKSDILKGSNNWLYTNDSQMIATYAHTDLMGDEEMDAAVNLFVRLNDYLESQGISFYYFPCYDKVSIYPEYFDVGINQYGNVSHSEQLLYGLSVLSDVKYADSKDALLTAKSSPEFDANDINAFPLYYKSFDANHWNCAGAHIGYEVLMNRIKEDYPDESIRILNMDDYNVSTKEIHANLYGYEYPPSELEPYYEIIQSNVTDISEWAVENRSYLHNINFTHEYENSACENDLKILIINDSFIRMFLASDIAEGFNHTLSIDLSNLQGLDETISSYDPDIVVLENTEFTYPHVIELLKNAAWLP